MKREPSFTSAYLRTLFSYVDGKLFWNERPAEHFKFERDCRGWNTKYAGKEAGSARTCFKRADGSVYRRWVIAIYTVNYHRAHLVYCLHHDAWPKQIDHQDCDSMNDRIENLRACTQSQNNANLRKRSGCSSGYKGVSWCKRDQLWQAQITTDGKHLHLGFFHDPAVAHAAYAKVAKSHFGEFARTE